MLPKIATESNSPTPIPNTVIKYGTLVKYDTHIDTINPFNITGGNIPVILFFILKSNMQQVKSLSAAAQNIY